MLSEIDIFGSSYLNTRYIDILMKTKCPQHTVNRNKYMLCAYICMSGVKFL